MTGSTYHAVWGRIFATVYDSAFALAERRGLRDLRRDVVGSATGRVVELGAGTGLNLEHYSDRVRELVLTEPDPHMATKLRKRLAAGPGLVSVGEVSVLEAPAEALPVENGSVDTVVSTLVLCTVRDPVQTLSEVARILRPGGTLLFAEHVRSRSLRAARWQDRLNRPWSWYACGCQCNRDTLATLADSPLQVQDVRRGRLRWISPLVRPLVSGVAVRSE